MPKITVFLVMRASCMNTCLFLTTRFPSNLALVHEDIPILLCHWEADLQILCITKS